MSVVFVVVVCSVSFSSIIFPVAVGSLAIFSFVNVPVDCSNIVAAGVVVVFTPYNSGVCHRS